MDDEREPAPEAGDEAIVETTDAVEAEDTEGQDETPPAEQDGSDEPEGEDKSRSKERRERRKAHLDQLRREKEQAEAAMMRLRRAAESDAEPRENDFTDLTEYSIAKAAWQLNRKTLARDESEAIERAREADAEERRVLIENYQDQVAEARNRYADFDAIVNNPTVKISPHVAELVIESDMAADLAYALASRPELAARVSQMTATQAAREIGRLEASLTRPKPRTTTQAPAPIKPVSARSSTPKSIDDDNLSFAEYRRIRMKQRGLS